MNRTPFATAAVASSHVQQGLFLLFAMLVTLLGCMAYQRMTQAPEPLLHMVPHAQSSHFSPVSSRSMEMPSARDFEQTAEVNAPAAPQQRWTF
ncbi:hypothetical protein [Pseudomonas sp. MWU16-30317]|uniref:hypothetical protein n=1 Tax=Pseudomonas sp. MWU16-30317 TaxID=2878095 RepID=UPI001CFC3D1E|nr:hypothetical protein [Pseudomonas sp. MWU16-30317]